MVREAFSHREDDIACFGYDWLGRQFAVRLKGDMEGKYILLFDPETGDVSKINRDLIDFHNIELVNSSDRALLNSEFEKWIAGEERKLEPNECVGLEIPLSLGGADTPENRKRIDMEVYWTFASQLLDQIKSLEDGTRIDRVHLIDS